MSNRKSEKTKRTLSIGSLNCHGIKDKIDYPELIHLISESDIFGVSETWLRDTDKIYIPNFEFYPLNRKTNKGPTKGGIGVFIKSEIKKYVKIRYDLSDETFLWCKISKDFTGYHDDIVGSPRMNQGGQMSFKILALQGGN